jgi:hypothetical protein
MTTPSDSDILEVDAIGARILTADGIPTNAPQRVARLIGLGVTAEHATAYLEQYRAQMRECPRPTPFHLFLVPLLIDKSRDDDEAHRYRLRTQFGQALGDELRDGQTSATTRVDQTVEASAGSVPVADFETKTDDGDDAPARKIVTRPLETSDLYLSAYFLTAGVKLLETRRQGTRVVFVFDAPAHELRNSWLDMSATVSAQMYAISIKNLKHLVATAA